MGLRLAGAAARGGIGVEPGHFVVDEPAVAAAERLEFLLLMLEWELHGRWRTGDVWAFEASLPVRYSAERQRYVDGDGAAIGGRVWDDDARSAFIRVNHPRERTTFGLGDLALRARRSLLGGAVTASGGVSVPVGRTEGNPFLTPESYGGTTRHLFYGTGTFDPLGGIEVSVPWGDAALVAWASARASLYDNGHGYRAGPRAAGGAGLASPLGLPDWRFTLEPEVDWEGVSTWDGATALNTGRTDVFVTLAAAWRLSPAWAVTLLAKTPAWTRVNGGQVELPVVVSLGAVAGIGQGATSSATQAPPGPAPPSQASLP